VLREQGMRDADGVIAGYSWRVCCRAFLPVYVHLRAPACEFVWMIAYVRAYTCSSDFVCVCLRAHT
jgi:hypothetical protein